MPLLHFIHHPKNELERAGRSAASATEPERSCPNCHRTYPVRLIREAVYTCPDCGYHYRIGARRRIQTLVDAGSFSELWEDLETTDPLQFPEYEAKLEKARNSSREKEGVLCGTASIGGGKCALFVMEPQFMMGSMGCVVGEKITRLFEYALEQRLPVIGFTVSGGARMQEGLLSLMQMAKTSGAVARHSGAGLLYITVLTSPTTGGVTASFAMEGDLIAAEPGATVGFAGARVVEQTTRKALPKGFQTAESLLEHGFVDLILPRAHQKEQLAKLLQLHTGGRQ